jgi:hypothetical protein
MRTYGMVAMLTVLSGVVGVAGCDDPAVPEGDVVLLRVEPQGGATAVDLGTSVLITFDKPIMPVMVEYAALHSGDVTGPEVEGSWALSQNGTVLSFIPAAALTPATIYTVHLGGGMRGVHGEGVDLYMHGRNHMGGEWTPGSMMTGNGMVGEHPHMSDGWQHANGSYGMVFTFTTDS